MPSVPRLVYPHNFTEPLFVKKEAIPSKNAKSVI
jgi:hypothetical protein